MIKQFSVVSYTLNHKNGCVIFYTTSDGYIHICNCLIECNNKNNYNYLFHIKTEINNLLSIDISPNNKYLIISGGQPNIFLIYSINWSLLNSKIINQNNNINMLHDIEEWSLVLLFNQPILQLIHKSNPSKVAISDVYFLSNSLIVWKFLKNASNLKVGKLQYCFKNDNRDYVSLLSMVNENEIDHTHGDSLVKSFTCNNQSNVLISGANNGIICIYNVTVE